MSYSVCLSCYEIKHGAFSPCLSCGYKPIEGDDCAKHLLLSQHNYSVEKLQQFAFRMRSGEKWVIDAATTAAYLAQYAQSVKETQLIDETWDMVEEYRRTLDADDLEFFDELDEATQARSALLVRYSSFALRLEEVKHQGWDAVEAEFARILETDSRLHWLELVQTQGNGQNLWSVSIR